ncbi:MAG TPA: HAMP domain-containing protein, partial [Spirochaetota bacterium]
MNVYRTFRSLPSRNIFRFIIPNLLILPIILIIITQYSSFMSGSLKKARPFNFPDLIAYDNGGNIYLTEDGWKRVSKLRPDGTVSYTLTGGKRKNGFYEAWQIAVDSRGYLYLLNSVRDLDGSFNNREDIQVYDPDGKYVRTLRTFHHTKKEATDTPNFVYGRIIEMNITGNSVYYLFRETETVSSIRRIDIDTGREELLVKTPNNEDIIDFQAALGGFVVTKKRGEISLIHPDGSQKEMVLSGVPLIAPRTFSTNGDTIYLLDFGKMNVARIKSGKSESILSKETLSAQKITPSRSFFRTIATRDDGAIVSVDIINNRVITADSTGKVRSVITRAKYPPLHRAFMVLYILLCLFVISVAIFDIAFVYRTLLHGRLSLLTKQFIIFVVLFGVSMTFIAYVMYRATSERHESEFSDKLLMSAQIGSQSIDGDALAKIESPRDFGGQEYQKLQTQMWKLVNAKTEELGRNIYSVLYRKHGDTFYYTVDLYSYYGTMYPYTMMIPAQEKAFSDGIVSSASYSDLEGDWQIGVAPVRDSKGNIVGVFEIGTSLYIIDEIKKMFYTRLAIILIIASVIQLILFYAAYFYLFRSLRAIKKATAQIREGDHDVTINVHTGDEVEDLADGINEMTKRIRSYI